MAITNHERVGKALDLLRDGLAPFVEREFTSRYARRRSCRRLSASLSAIGWRPAGRLHTGTPRVLLKLMWDAWNDVFRRTLGQAERTLVSELRDGAQPLGASGTLLH